MEQQDRKAHLEDDDAVPVTPGVIQATFDRLYESRDEKLVLFETRDGHLVAIDASKLI